MNGLAVCGLRLAVGSFASLIYRVPGASGLPDVASRSFDDGAKSGVLARSRSFPL